MYIFAIHFADGHSITSSGGYATRSECRACGTEILRCMQHDRPDWGAIRVTTKRVAD